jgi:hypothetical protein
MPVFRASHGEHLAIDEIVAFGLFGFPGQKFFGRHCELACGVSHDDLARDVGGQEPIMRGAA